MKRLMLTLALFLAAISLHSQTEKSTNDLSFLIGEWEVTRINNPSSDEPISRTGTLSCRWALDKQYIACTYTMERPRGGIGLDEVFFNYNSIYDQYESMWLSSTWPIKATMSGGLVRNNNGLIMKSTAEFPIANQVMEYVKGELTLTGNNYFQRETYIRTSEDQEGYWRHHMTEKVSRVKR